MTKRRCPFSDDVNVQHKMRVGLKEISTGVCKDYYMKEIYERTRMMMFNGMNGFKVTMNPKSEMNVSQTAWPSGGCPLPMLFKVENVSIPPQGQQALGNSQNTATRSEVCASCQRNQVGGGSCCFCDKKFCSDCLRTCSRCEEIFCPLCSILSYKEQAEVAICLTCYEH